MLISYIFIRNYRHDGVKSGVDRRAPGCPFPPFRRDLMNLDGIRVLLVEDNPGDARLFTELVRETGAGQWNWCRWTGCRPRWIG